MSYRDLVIGDGAVAYWRLGETAGTTAADRIGGRNGTISGGVTLNQPGAVADDRAMLFDGATNSVINVPGIQSYPISTGPFTLECWVKPTSVPVGAYWYLDTKLASTITRGCGVLTDATLGVNAFVCDGTTSLSLGGGIGLLTVNAWHYVVLTVERLYDGIHDRAQLYLDQLRADAKDLSAAGWNLTPATALAIGAFSGGGAIGNNFIGFVDEVALYPLALTPAQIAAHYAAASVGVPALISVAGVSGLQYLFGQPALTMQTGTGNWLALAEGWKYLVVTTTGLGTISAGTLVLEETDDPNDGVNATPRQLGSAIDCSLLSGGKKTCTHLSPGAYSYLRARLSADVVGGGGVFVSIAGR